ncbi:phosphatidylethanolamine-binding protein [Corynascus novoguineensis]|uniref:Phosphatidylethanolamine-binding protein n=1 Tax=Corynascus novoguineensis TaxID=1126955 RepID=A0AAN7CR22_9PEZI|nr:phosphatidylethanolamine-binding protein [Corynascus novoguineensis]
MDRFVLQFLFAEVVCLFAVCAQAAPPQQHILGVDDPEGRIPPSQIPQIVRERLKEAEIIPTVIDDFLPSIGLHATWPSEERALLGNVVDPEALHDEPLITLHDMRAASTTATRADTEKKKKKQITFVIVLTDPDAPSHDNPKWSEFCHWIASGRLPPPEQKPPPCDPKDPRVPCAPPLPLVDPDELVKYRPPAPPPGTGPHRYVLLALVPANGTTDHLHLSRPAARKRWGYDTDAELHAGFELGGKRKTKGVREWAAENGLAPVGANFVYAKHER